jgi:transposase
VNLGTPTITSSRVPGLGDITGARLLAEIGDDPQRYRDPRVSKRSPGAAPITRASGRSTSITRRRVKNNRLAAVGFVWAFPCPGPAKDGFAGQPQRHQLVEVRGVEVL